MIRRNRIADIVARSVVGDALSNDVKRLDVALTHERDAAQCEEKVDENQSWRHAAFGSEAKHAPRGRLEAAATLRDTNL